MIANCDHLRPLGQRKLKLKKFREAFSVCWIPGQARNNGRAVIHHPFPCCRADGAKVAALRRALGGHALYEYSTAKTGAFGNHLFEFRNRPRGLWPVRASLIAARLGEQRRGFRRNAAGGGLLFDYLRLAKQEKVNRQSGETDITDFGEN